MKFPESLPKPKYAGLVLQLAQYTTALAPPPSKVYWEYKVPVSGWGMMANDTIGDCEVARIAHMIMCFTAHTGTMVIPTTDEVLEVYSAVTGYNPKTGANDTGAATMDVLNYWMENGIAGHYISGWVQIQPTIEAIKQAVYLFGGAATDIAIYASMMEQSNNGQPWDNISGSMMGYHAVPVFGYGSQGNTCVTWGALQQSGWPTFMQVLQAAYAVITPDWIDAATQKTPSGFNLETLKSDLLALNSGGV